MTLTLTGDQQSLVIAALKEYISFRQRNMGLSQIVPLARGFQEEIQQAQQLLSEFDVPGYSSERTCND